MIEEYKIGEIFKYEETSLKCIKAYATEDRCGNCYFHNIKGCINRACCPPERSDGNFVIFIASNNYIDKNLII